MNALFRLDILNEYLIEAEKKPKQNKLYIEDLKVSIEWEMKNPTKNYTQECIGWIDYKGKVSK